MSPYKTGCRLCLLLLFAFPLMGCNEKDADLFYRSIPYIVSVRIYKGPSTYAEVDVERLKPLLKQTKHRDGNPIYKEGAYNGCVFLQDGTDLDLHISNFDTYFKVEGIKGFFRFEGEFNTDNWPEVTRTGDVSLWKDLVDEAWKGHKVEMEMPSELSRDLNSTKMDRVKRKEIIKID